MDLQTPVWVTLLVAALGVLGTLAAGLLAQSRTAAREQERARQEVEREAARWSEQATRDEARRWLAERRAVYASFLVAVSRWERYIAAKRDQRVDRNGGVVPIDAGVHEDAVDHAYATVQVVGAAAPVVAAHAAYEALVLAMVHLEATHFSATRLEETLAQAREGIGAFISAVRRDLELDESTPLTA